MTKHTPGPWKIGALRSKKLRKITASGWYIAAVFVGLPSTAADERLNANAHLIAAAPEMLEALKKAVEVFCIEVPFGNSTIAQMRAIITKAEGR